MNSAPVPVVSVLLPVFNGRATLVSAIQSVLDQTFADFELLVINDGSTDDTAALALSLGDPRVRVIGDATQRGLAARLNEGIEAARGRYIARMDADDLCFPERLRQQVDYLDAHGDVDLVGGRAVVFRDGGEVIGLLPFAAGHADICARPWRSFHLAHPTWMGRAEWFRRYRYAKPEVMRAEDQELLLRSHADSRFACLDQVVLAYRQGRFNLRKTWLARRALVAAQCRYFLERRQWVNFALVLATAALKVAIDLLAAMPGGERLFFARMSEPVPPHIADQIGRWDLSVKPKLLFLMTEDWFFCSHFIARAVAARQAGYDVAVVARVNAHDAVIKNAGLRLIPSPLVRRSINPLREAWRLWKLVCIYRAERPDLVHQVALKPVIYGTLAARVAGLRAVINAPIGMGYVFTSGERLATVLRPLVRAALAWLLNPPGSRVVFENVHDLQELVDAGSVRQNAAVLIRGAGVDLNQFHPTPEPAGDPVILLTARMLRDKGIREFVDAARRLRAEGVKARFLLVGGADSGNPSAIDESVLRGWAAEGVVEWLGHRTDIPALIAACHIVCLPSYREGLPKSLLEAAACGRPIVTCDVPGCNEAVQHGDNGLLVPARDAKSLADALKVLIQSPDLRVRMGARGRERAVNEFSNEQVVRETIALYDRFLRDGEPLRS